MTPEYPPNPRAELEAKVTALLLGELSADEAANVRELIAHDAELARLQTRLSQTLDFVRESAAMPEIAGPASPTPLKLSLDRREKLLAHFKTLRPEEFAEPRRRNNFLVAMLAAFAIATVVAALVRPSLSKTKFMAAREEKPLLESRGRSYSTFFARTHTKKVKPDLLNLLRVPPPTPDAGVVSTSQIILPRENRQQAGAANTLAVNNDDRSLQTPDDNQNTTFAPTPAPAVMAAPAASSENADYDKIAPPATSAISSDEGKMAKADGITTPPEERKDKVVTLGSTGLNQPSRPPEGAMNGVIGIDRQRLESAPHAGMAMIAGKKSGENRFGWGSGGEHAGLALSPSFNEPIGLQGGAAPLSGSAASGTVMSLNGSTPPGSATFESRAPLDKTAEGVDYGAATYDSKDGADAPLAHPMIPAPAPQPEALTSVNAFTTFSLNVSDVAFKLAQASLQNGVMPDAASMRSEEFINAFDYRDPEPAAGAPIGFAWERAGDPFAHNRDFLRFSIKTAAQGREAGRPLNLVLLLDKSGSMERADRVEIIAQALKALASELKPNDTLSVVVFARAAHLFVDGVSGKAAAEIAKKLRDMTPEGGTNLEEAMKLAYATALRHYLAGGENRVVLMTDGAANLGNVDPDVLKKNVEGNRQQGIALDCFGIGWDGYNDNLLETLSRAGNGRYGFLNTPEEAATEFAGKLAGALRVAAADVKVQVEFNPKRVTSYRQIGYAKDQLKKEDFRDNNVKAAQIGAAESGNALYTIEINPAGEGDIGAVHVRFRAPGTERYEEHQWTVPYTGASVPLDKASPAMRLAASAASFCEWLAGSPYAGEVTPARLLEYLNGAPQAYGADNRPARLQMMILQARRISDK